MEYHDVRVLPLVKEIEINLDGKTYVEMVNNLTQDEQDNISVDFVMYKEEGEEAWLDEKPLYVNISGSIRDKLYYVYNDLTKEEKIKYQGRTKVLTLSRPINTKRSK